MRFDEARDALLENMQAKTAELRHRLDLAKTGLEAASPLSALQKGYSVVMPLRDGKLQAPIRRAKDVKPGETLVIRPLEGLITAITEKINSIN
jgi:exodeoxyribonuclease VII large subunit